MSRKRVNSDPFNLVIEKNDALNMKWVRLGIGDWGFCLLAEELEIKARLLSDGDKI